MHKEIKSGALSALRNMTDEQRTFFDLGALHMLAPDQVKIAEQLANNLSAALGTFEGEAATVAAACGMLAGTYMTQSCLAVGKVSMVGAEESIGVFPAVVNSYMIREFNMQMMKEL